MSGNVWSPMSSMTTCCVPPLENVHPIDADASSWVTVSPRTVDTASAPMRSQADRNGAAEPSWAATPFQDTTMATRAAPAEAARRDRPRGAIGAPLDRPAVAGWSLGSRLSGGIAQAVRTGPGPVLACPEAQRLLAAPEEQVCSLEAHALHEGQDG